MERQTGPEGRKRGCGATHCYGCVCDTCANSVELLSWYVTIGEAAAMVGFEIVNRITFRDKVTGKEYR